MPGGIVRVLLIASDDDDYRRVKDLFAQAPLSAYRLDRAADFSAAMDSVEKALHDVYLAADPLGTHSGIDLVGEADRRDSRAPIILLTNEHDEEQEIESQAVTAGAADCLNKQELTAGALKHSMRCALLQKRYQDAIRQVNLQLEQRVLERTAEQIALNEKLQAEVAERARVEEQLREADHRKDQFLATLAHELRNPLSPLTSAAQLIGLEPERADQVRELAIVLTRQLGQLVRLIDDLLDVSRISGGKLQLRKTIIPIQESVTAALDVSRQHMEEAGHTLQVSLPDDLLWVEGDPVRLTQVISNLLINAAKYTPPGGVIDFSVREESQQIVIRVRDSGVGIPVEQQAEIFKLFAQVDSSRTRQQGGLGIGLTLVKTLVEMHGGTVSVSSRGSGYGSEFTVRLPLGAAEEPVPQASRPEHAGNGRLRSLRVLVVDDSESAVHLLARLLTRLGQTVKVAYSVDSAMKLVPTFEPQIVISDVGMPEVSGLNLAQKIRAQKTLSQPKLIAVTGYGQENDRREILAAGFDEHYTKPIGLPLLEEILAEAGEEISSPFANPRP